jgi:hypothetical protein
MANPHTLEKLFGNGSFKRFAPYFFDKPITSTEVMGLCDVPRTTIDDIRDKYLIREMVDGIPRYNYLEWGRGQGKPFRLKMDILSDYLAIKMGLNSSEKELLLKIINNQNIKPVIVRNNKAIDTVLSKIILIILLLNIVSFKVDDKTKRFLLSEGLKKLFLASGLFDILQNKPTKEKVETDQIQALTEKDIEVYGNIFKVTSAELENFGGAFKRFADTNDKVLLQLCKNFRNSNFVITTYPSNWYEVLSTVTEPVAWHQGYVKRKSKRELKHIIKHESKQERYTIGHR